MVTRTALLAVLTSLLIAACDALPVSAPPTAATQPAAPAPVPAGTLSGQLAALQIAPEDTGAHYDRDDWLPEWARNGECSTRETVLKLQGKGVVVDGRCAPTAGEWYSRYDGVTVTNADELEIDHIVPLAEAARSGPVVDGRRLRPGEWSVEQRQAFANDIEGLLAVTSASNRSKSDDDPARWLPPQDHCGYIAAWLHMKTKYQLSVDQAEHDAIAAVITTCPAQGG